MSTSSVFNFGAGPAKLPAAVMQQAQEEFLDWHGSGISVIEMSHRSQSFAEIMAKSEQDLRQLLAIDENYTILFLQGGATHMMSMLPLNFIAAGGSASYLLTGSWSEKAVKEAKRLAHAHVLASSKEQNYMTIPASSQWQLAADPAYLYYCDNETISGVEFQSMPDMADMADMAEVPLVADMTSNFLSRDVEIRKFGCVFAGAQKNIGPAGLTVAIVREDLIGRSGKTIPALYDFKTQAESNSLSNTPATFSWYMAGLTFSWILQQGGVTAMHHNAVQRSQLVYDYIDTDDFYSNPVDAQYRSRMNVPFVLADAALDSRFLTQAADNGLLELKGHRSVGGMRASMYNGMPLAGAEALVAFMRDFSQRYA